MPVKVSQNIPVVPGVLYQISQIIYYFMQAIGIALLHLSNAILKFVTAVIMSPMIYLIMLYAFFTIFILIIIGLIIKRDLIGEALGKSSNKSSNIRSDGSNIDPYASFGDDDDDSEGDKGWFSGDSWFNIGPILSSPPDLKIDRGELDTGRCDDVENITSSDNRNCNNTNPKEDIVWKMNSAMNPDYMLLPPELRKKDQAEISIPFKKVEGFYTPDCSGSYYTKTGEKTGLLEDDKKLGSCKIVRKNAKNYGSTDKTQ